MKKSIGLNFRGVRTVYRGEVAEFPVEVAPVRMDAARAERLARELSRRLGREVVIGDAELTVYVGKSAEIPFLGLAEGNGVGNAAFVNLDASASDELLLDVAAHEAGHLLGTVRHAGEGLAACAYIAGETVRINNGETLGKVTIASNAITPEPYAKYAYVSSGAIAQDTVVSSGGTMYLSGGAIGYDLHISGGGATTGETTKFARLYVLSGAKVSGLTVYNEGGANGVEMVNISRGAVVSNAVLQKGRIVVRAGGALYNIVNSGSFYQYGYVSGGSTVAGEFVVSAGTLEDFGVSAGTYLRVGAIAKNVRVKGTLNVSSGSVVSSASVIGGGLIKSFDSCTLSKITVEAGGVSAVKAVASEITVNGGNFWLFTGTTVNNATVNGGTFQLWEANTVADTVTVAAGAVISANALGYAFNYNVAGGAEVRSAGKFIWGGVNTYIDSAAVFQNGAGSYVTYGENFKAENGIFTGVDVTNVDINIANGVVISDGKLGGTAVIRVFSGGVVKGMTIDNGGQLVLSNGSDAVASDVVVNEGGKIAAANYGRAYNYDVKAGAIVYNTGNFVWGGENTNIAANVVADYGAEFYAEDGVFNNVALAAGKYLKINSGAKVDGGTVAGGGLYASNGGIIDGTVVGSGGIFLSSGAVASNVLASSASGAGNAGSMRVSNGGYASKVSAVSTGYVLAIDGGVIDTATLLDGGLGYVSAGGTFNDTVVNGGLLNVYDVANRTTMTGGSAAIKAGGVMKGVTAANGSMFVSNGGSASGVVLTNNGSAEVYSGGTMTDLKISNAGGAGRVLLKVYGGTVSGAKFGIDAGMQVPGIYVSGGGTLSASEIDYAYVRVYDGGLVSGGYMINGNLITVNDNTRITDVSVRGGVVIACAGTMDHLTLSGGSTIVSGGTLRDIAVKKNVAINILDLGGTVERVDLEAGTMNVSGGTVSDVTVGNSGLLTILAGNTVEDVFFHSAAYAKRGALCIDIKADAAIDGFKTQTWGGNVYISGALRDVENNGAYLRTRGNGYISGGWTTSGEVWASNGCTISGHTLYGSRADMYILGGGVASDTIVSGGNFNLRGGNASGVIVYDGIVRTFQNEQTAGGTLEGVTMLDGLLHIESGAATLVNATDATIEVAAGASLTQFTATGDTAINIDFTGVEDTATAMIDSFANVDASTVSVSVTGIGAAGTYALAGAGSVAGVDVNDGLYTATLGANGSYTNAATGLTYSFVDGNKVTATAFEIAAKATAAALSADDTALNTNDRAAKWDATTTYSGSVSFANSGIQGDAWLTIDGTDVSSALYGAAGEFAHTVNIAAKSGTIRNLAAGAAAGGSVDAVNLTLSGADLTGVAYAGGFGSVENDTTTLITAGTFAKDFYAGALANKNAEATSVDDVNIVVEGGTFAGNIYGASSVKTSTTVGNGIRHTAGDVLFALVDGETTKRDFCAFAGGYATGDATGTVYTVNSVLAGAEGGTWTKYTTNEDGDFTWVEAHGGRGFFGGIMASGVTAEVLGNNDPGEGVIISVKDGVIGNIYGGGWAQKGGSSIVTGSVTIDVEGGAVANIFGGGAHSTDGAKGTTSINGDVDITVRGATVTGSIFAKGQSEGDSVTGSAVVTISGNYRTRTDTRDTSFAADIYGYSYVGGEGNSDALNFTDFNGWFTGAIGGFNEVNFTGDTQIKFDTAAGKEIKNAAWNFDVTERFEFVTDDPILTWETGADFSEDTITLNLATGDTTVWSLVSAAADTVYNKFNVQVDGTDIATGLDLGQAISGGAYDGWGFALEENVLKFKNLA